MRARSSPFSPPLRYALPLTRADLFRII